MTFLRSFDVSLLVFEGLYNNVLILMPLKFIFRTYPNILEEFRIQGEGIYANLGKVIFAGQTGRRLPFNFIFMSFA